MTPLGQLRLISMFRSLRAGGLKPGLLDRMARTPFTQHSNLTFTPSMSAPLHMAPAELGGRALPPGMQFVGAPNTEAVLIRLAAQLEQASPWSLIAGSPL